MPKRWRERYFGPPDLRLKYHLSMTYTGGRAHFEHPSADRQTAERTLRSTLCLQRPGLVEIQFMNPLADVNRESVNKVPYGCRRSVYFLGVYFRSWGHPYSTRSGGTGIQPAQPKSEPGAMMLSRSGRPK